jgi:hypothetical protein
MPLYASNINIHGTISGVPLYANTLGVNNLSNITIGGNVSVQGNLHASGRFDTGATMYATFRLSSNVAFNATEIIPSSTTTLDYDPTSGDLSVVSAMDLVLPNPENFNDFSAGFITLPASGLYCISLQGSFVNDPANGALKNGVYMRFLNHANPSTRVGAAFSSGDLVSTTYVANLLAGDKLQPVFFSNDPLAQLNSANGETFITFTIVTTLTPNMENFVRDV